MIIVSIILMFVVVLLSPDASISIKDEDEIAIIPATNTAIKKNAALFFTDLLIFNIEGI